MKKKKPRAAPITAAPPRPPPKPAASAVVLLLLLLLVEESLLALLASDVPVPVVACASITDVPVESEADVVGSVVLVPSELRGWAVKAAVVLVKPGQVVEPMTVTVVGLR